MDILSTLKTEYSRTLILIIIPGSIALEPFGVMLYKYFDLHINDLNDFFIYLSLSYLFASIFLGFLIQDLGARLEILLDKLFCHLSKRNYTKYDKLFTLYLFNSREENFIITHYYRSLLVRLKFELHTVVAIFIMWLGFAIRAFVVEKYVIDNSRTFVFLLISLATFIYLLYEGFEGVKQLHKHRVLINRKFKPRLV